MCISVYCCGVRLCKCVSLWGMFVCVYVQRMRQLELGFRCFFIFCLIFEVDVSANLQHTSQPDCLASDLPWAGMECTLPSLTFGADAAG